MNGTNAVIPILWVDDTGIQHDRQLALDIIALDTDGDRTGSRSRHLIRLTENDASWKGAATDTYAQRNFRVKLARSAAGLQITVAAGAGNDGLPLFTVGDVSSQTEGIVPAGVFPGTVQFDTAAHFTITSPPMPVPASGIRVQSRTCSARSSSKPFRVRPEWH